MGSSYGSSDDYNYGNLEETLLGSSLGSEVGAQLGPFDGTIEWNEDGNIEGLSLQDSLGCPDRLVHG